MSELEIEWRLSKHPRNDGRVAIICDHSDGPETVIVARNAELATRIIEDHNTCLHTPPPAAVNSGRDE